MARTQQPLVSVTGGPPRGGDTPHALDTTLDRFLAIQRPAVVAHLRALRRRHPDATAVELARMLERRYLAAVTSSGAAVGATAVIPAIGTGVTLALSGLETAGFLESTALYAQSLSELHGIAVDDPSRARALVLTMMLGREGSDLVRQFGGQLTGEAMARSAYWGELVTSTLPQMVVGPLVDRLRSAFIRQFALRGGASLVGRAIPFGIGAVIGGTGNHILGRRVVTNSRLAFGPPPAQIPAALSPGDAPGAVRRLGAAAGGSVLRAGRVLRAAVPSRKKAPALEPPPSLERHPSRPARE
ncbi:hypothetical protein O159_09010 [Leifsonia xyli subsp. cynodontis DSM 46306]|uniref:Di-and tripeptidase n=1 Tax=Leifsonia xyli subsp. cynodontis DSM 46306 TaxID=1389489 RepID=U3PC00_LEIXC|nr:hypothetical protein [Leifsonia xyli]AGW41038.1 hypothetical protein O159_09010 [Leifsonia xyli subsp. cynodontis DSM 46306]